MKDLSHYRKTYNKSDLTESAIPDQPMKLFNLWFHESESVAAEEEVNAMSLTTLESDGFPKARIVLLKMFTEEGFVFFTNYLSNKGRAISANPNVGISFFWPWVERQVIIKGVAEKVPAEVSDTYFYSRPVGSRLGAVASNQSEEVPSREFLNEKLADLEKRYLNEDIPRPEHWGGYMVRPVEIEFWQGRPNRMHDRILFRKENESWKRIRLSP